MRWLDSSSSIMPATRSVRASGCRFTCTVFTPVTFGLPSGSITISVVAARCHCPPS